MRGFRVYVIDLDTNEEIQRFDCEHVEVTDAVGFKRLDPDDGGPQPPELAETGAKTWLVKAWTGESVGMTKFEDFVNFTDETGGAPDNA